MIFHEYKKSAFHKKFRRFFWTLQIFRIQWFTNLGKKLAAKISRFFLNNKHEVNQLKFSGSQIVMEILFKRRHNIGLSHVKKFLRSFKFLHYPHAYINENFKPILQSVKFVTPTSLDLLTILRSIQIGKKYQMEKSSSFMIRRFLQ